MYWSQLKIIISIPVCFLLQENIALNPNFPFINVHPYFLSVLTNVLKDESRILFDLSWDSTSPSEMRNSHTGRRQRPLFIVQFVYLDHTWMVLKIPSQVVFYYASCQKERSSKVVARLGHLETHIVGLMCRKYINYQFRILEIKNKTLLNSWRRPA